MRPIPIISCGIAAAAVIVALAACIDPDPRSGGEGGEPAAKAPAPALGEAAAAAAPAPEAKPLPPSVQKALAWLVERQHESGGWGQGEESSNMGHSLDHLRDRANVADTGMAALALIRAGSTPASGPHAEAIRRALGFVCSEVEAAPEDGLSITSIQGTRVQMKIGTHVDTFVAAMLLAETRGKMPDDAGNRRIAAALDKVMDKIEKNQRPDGTWDNRGWAPVLSQGLAAKAMNRAVLAGARFDAEAILRAEEQARVTLAMAGGPAPESGAPAAGRPLGVPGVGGAAGRVTGPGDAGVAIYSQSASLGALSDTAANADTLERDYEEKRDKAKDEAERKAAEEKLAYVRGVKQAEATAQQSIVARLGDAGFVSGFGSNGGEEFLSYMNLSESLARKGGEDWEKWNRSMHENLARVQNDDGSWTGHHCITGRTFCTSAALLVLTSDRAPFPVADRVARR